MPPRRKKREVSSSEEYEASEVELSSSSEDTPEPSELQDSSEEEPAPRTTRRSLAHRGRPPPVHDTRAQEAQTAKRKRSEALQRLKDEKKTRASLKKAQPRAAPGRQQKRQQRDDGPSSLEDSEDDQSEDIRPRKKKAVKVVESEDEEEKSESEDPWSSPERQKRPTRSHARARARAHVQYSQPKRRRSGGGGGGAMMVGARDYADSDRGEDNDLSDFIASDEDPEAEESELNRDTSALVEDKEEEEQEEQVVAPHEPSASQDSQEDLPSNKQRTSKKSAARRASLIIDVSSSESEEDIDGLTRELQPEPEESISKVRRRLTKLADAKVAPSLEQQHRRLATSQLPSGSKPPTAAVNDQSTLKKARKLPQRAATRRHDSITAGEKIRLAQMAFRTQQEEEPGAPRLDEDGNEIYDLLTDQGEPSTSYSEEEEEEEEGGYGYGNGNGEVDMDYRDSERISDKATSLSSEDRPYHRRRHGKAAAGAGAAAEAEAIARSPSWQRAVEELGIRQPSERDLFDTYVEYMLMCYIDPGYKELVAASPQHRRIYGKAFEKFEYAMTAARSAVHSEAWRSCHEGLLEAVEWLPGAESGWDPDASMHDWHEEMEERCAACNRRKSHTTRLITFKGRPRPPMPAEDLIDKPSNRFLSQDFSKASPVYQRNRGWKGQFATKADREREEHPFRSQRAKKQLFPKERKKGEDDNEEEESEDDEEESGDDDGDDGELPFERREFRVGSFCAARLMLYHGLFHWKHRLLSRLKRELKRELRRRRPARHSLAPADVADALLKNEGVMDKLYENYLQILEMTQPYKLAGGEEQRGRDMVTAMHTQVAEVLAQLHDDSEGEECSVAWTHDQGSDGGGGGDTSDDDDSDGAEGEEREEGGEEEEGEGEEGEEEAGSDGGSGDGYGDAPTSGKESYNAGNKATAGAVNNATTEAINNAAGSGAGGLVVPPGACFRCGQVGHWSRNCPNPGSVGKCFTCGQEGHWSSNCPRNPRRLSGNGGGSQPYSQPQSQQMTLAVTPPSAMQESRVRRRHLQAGQAAAVAVAAATAAQASAAAASAAAAAACIAGGYSPRPPSSSGAMRQL